jgi:hypothetical protein
MKFISLLFRYLQSVVRGGNGSSRSSSSCSCIVVPLRLSASGLTSGPRVQVRASSVAESPLLQVRESIHSHKWTRSLTLGFEFRLVKFLSQRIRFCLPLRELIHQLLLVLRQSRSLAFRREMYVLRQETEKVGQ